MEIIWIAIAAIFLGLLPGIIAKGQGRSFLSWWVYGTFLFPVALVHILYSKGRVGTKYCPFCHTRVRYNAPHCTRCGYEFIEF